MRAAAATIAITLFALTLSRCGKTEVPQGPEMRWEEERTIKDGPDWDMPVILDTIPVEEYYTVTSKLAWAEPDSNWSDTIFRRLERPLSRWLADGFIFVNNRRDTIIMYQNGIQGIWMSEEWRYWTLED